MATYATVSPTGVATAILQANSKKALNNSGSSLPQFSVCSWTNTSTLEPASALNMQPDKFAGIAVAAIPNGQYGLVQRNGKLPGAITSLNAVAGQPVFLDETAGQMTLDTSGFQETSTILKLGYAEPPDGQTGLATDLFIEIEYISED